jgi:hypothetical protein
MTIFQFVIKFFAVISGGENRNFSAFETVNIFSMPHYFTFYQEYQAIVHGMGGEHIHGFNPP